MGREMQLDKHAHAIQDRWIQAWPEAIADWSPFVQLHEPKWCWTESEEQAEGLTSSFAMIRLVDHSVVVSLRQVRALGLEDFASEILAHEVGHHVYCPSDLTDNARLLARIRRGLPGCFPYVPMVANLYADLMINDRLQRVRGRKIDQVYRILVDVPSKSKLWRLYMRIYEVLWNLPTACLTMERLDPVMNQDAVLGARLIRSYAKDWLGGAGRFACLCLRYVSEDQEEARSACKLWGDTLQAGASGFPDGLTTMDEDELEGALHPADDPLLNGLEPIDVGDGEARGGRVASEASGRKTIKSYREPFEYAEVLKASGVVLSDRDIAIRYYRERAVPHLIPFPVRCQKVSTDPHPEGLDLWDISSDLENVDWTSSVAASPVIIPGVTTRERLQGYATGNEPEAAACDLYLGVDCSGSMRDPALTLSYPILAGAIIALSALRAKACVKVVLSGEPGTTVSTEGFVRSEREIMRSLLNYLGTGYSFGIHRLAETFTEELERTNPVHILIVSDYDIFQMLDEQGDQRLGWDVAKEAVRRAGGGGTYVLQLPGYHQVEKRFQSKLDRMKSDGWHVHMVNSMEEMLDFAKQFSRSRYHQTKVGGRVHGI